MDPRQSSAKSKQREPKQTGALNSRFSTCDKCKKPRPYRLRADKDRLAEFMLRWEPFLCSEVGCVDCHLKPVWPQLQDLRGGDTTGGLTRRDLFPEQLPLLSIRAEKHQLLERIAGEGLAHLAAMYTTKNREAVPPPPCASKVTYKSRRRDVARVQFEAAALAGGKELVVEVSREKKTPQATPQ